MNETLKSRIIKNHNLQNTDIDMSHRIQHEYQHARMCEIPMLEDSDTHVINLKCRYSIYY
jgi:hypothetical protein